MSLDERHLKALEAARGDAPPTTKGRKGSLLPSAPPPPDAGRDTLSSWLTVALALGADAVDRVERYGRHEDARLVVILASGRRVTFDRAGDIFDPRRLERGVVLATGATVPHYAGADTATIAGVIVRAADTLDEADARDEAGEWGRTFLVESVPGVVEVASVATPAGRYEAVSILAAPRRPADPYTPPAARAVTVLDVSTGNRWIRTSDFAAHVRAEGERLNWGRLNARMIEVGWLHLGEVQQRQPSGPAKPKASLFEAPGGWGR